MKSFYMGDIKVGIGEQPLVIPEIGINHEGSLSVAKEMVDAAYRAGARLVKHQTHICEDEMCQVAKNVVPGNAKESIYEIMERCALSEEEEYELMKYTENKGMLFLSTPFSRAAADRLERFGVKAYKIGSGEMNNYPLIQHIASFGKPMIVSTGMNDISSIQKTVTILEKAASYDEFISYSSEFGAFGSNAGDDENVSECSDRLIRPYTYKCCLY